MKKRLIGILICMLVLFSAFSLTVTSELIDGNTIYVDDDGADYTSIQDAVNSASDGDTIYVYSGTYYEHVKINTSIVLQGEDKESTIIDAGGSGDAIFVTADYVEVTGFSVINSAILLVYRLYIISKDLLLHDKIIN